MLEMLHEDIDRYTQSEKGAVAFFGYSLGAGLNFAPTRTLLDRGASLVISSDDYRYILYNQRKLRRTSVWKKGVHM